MTPGYKVSIIVPNYNHAPYLSKRLDSIFQQTYQNFEVILLDDASTDESINILKSYRDRFINKVSCLEVNKKNTGSPFLQWQKGLDKASGDYIWIAESDDWCDPTFLEKSLKILLDHPEVGLVSCISYIIDENDQIIESLSSYLYFLKEATEKGYFIEKGLNFLVKNMLFKNFINNASGVVFKKACISYSPMDYKTLRQNGDHVFWSCMLPNTSVAYINEHLNYWRKHQASVSSVNRKTSLTVREHYLFLKKLTKVIPSEKINVIYGSYNKLYYQAFRNWMLFRKMHNSGVVDDIHTIIIGSRVDRKLLLRYLRYNLF